MPRDPEKHRANGKRWYYLNKQYYYDNNKRIIARNRKFVADYKTGKPCTDCGLRYAPYVMDFDHVRDKKLINISEMRSWSIKKVEEEIAKCDLVCSNCHRERTHQRRILKI